MGTELLVGGGAGIGEADADHILAAGKLGQNEGDLVESGVLADILVQSQHPEGFQRLAGGVLDRILAVKVGESLEGAFQQGGQFRHNMQLEVDVDLLLGFRLAPRRIVAGQAFKER